MRKKLGFKLIQIGLGMLAKATGATHIRVEESPRGTMVTYHYMDDPLFYEFGFLTRDAK